MVQVAMVGVSKSWSDESVALRDITLTIESGEFFGIVGPSGSGKSTLLRCIAGLEEPEFGTIAFDGEKVNHVPEGRRGLGFVPQGTALYTHMTAGENIGFPLLAGGVKRGTREAAVESHSQRFGLRKLLHRKPRQLSAGQQHLVAAGRATVRDHRLLLLDEPFATLDRPARGRVRPQLRQLTEGGRTIVFATNDQAEAFAMSDRIGILNNGELIQVGRPADVYERPANVFVAEFIGNPAMNVVAARAEGVSLVVGDDRLDLPVPAPVEGRVLVGIRPEHVSPAHPGSPFSRCVHGRVTLTELLGDDSLVHLAFGGPDSGALDFVIRVDSATAPRAGDPIEVWWDVGRLHFFDPATHELIQ